MRWIPATAVKRDERLAASEINKHKAYGWQLKTVTGWAMTVL